MIQKYNYSFFIILFSFILGACNKIERISAIRITNVEMLKDSLSAIVSGEIIDSELKDGSITDHGFCFTQDFAGVELGGENVDTLSLGPMTDENKVFSDTAFLKLPNTTYYVRAYMVVDGKIIYGSPKAIRSRNFRIEDLNLGILSTVTTFGVTDTLIINSFINKKKIETEPVTLLDFGTKASFTTDSTTAHVVLGTPTTNDIIYFSHKRSILDIGIPPANLDNVYVWAFARFFVNANPNDIRTIYTQRKTVNIKP
ncbi:MAG: hypothetical protein MUC49_06820 [Raineya sp.]|jgi:hypothetical protein|nr:hypothetical protein [Raineya sp.]